MTTKLTLDRAGRVLIPKTLRTELQLGPGDSFAFPSTLPHMYRNPGSEVTRVIWINTPPTF